MIEIDVGATVALASQHYKADETWTTSRMIEVTTEALAESTDSSSDVDFFVDTETDDRRAIKDAEEMSDDELTAFNAWLNSGLVLNAIGHNRTIVSDHYVPEFEGLQDRICD